jgi:hypothetical protein
MPVALDVAGADEGESRVVNNKRSQRDYVRLSRKPFLSSIEA